MFRQVIVDVPDVSDDGDQTAENPRDENEPETSDMSEYEVVVYELGTDGDEMKSKEKTESKLPSSSSREMPNWIREMLDSATEFDPSGVDAFEQVEMLHSLSDEANDELEFYGSQWSPSEEQIRILEMLYNGGIGGLRSPTVQEIEQITSQLINYGKVEVTDVYLWFQARKDPEREKQTITETPTSPILSKREGKGKAVSVEEKSGKEGVNSSLEMSDQQTENSPTTPRVGGRSKGNAVPIQEKSGLQKVGDMLSKMLGLESREKQGSDNSRYDSTGKLLPIDSEKQRELIPTVEENIDVRANIIFLDRDFLDEADPHIPSQQHASVPTVQSSSTSSNREEESRPEDNNKTADPKKRRWFHLFPWWQKK